MDHEHAPADRAGANWNETRVSRLIQLWNARLSAAGIAAALGPDVTRSAVVGKLLRLGLRRSGEERHAAQVEGALSTLSRHRVAGRRSDGPPERPVRPLPAPTPCAVTPRMVEILDLPRRGCRWPYVEAATTRFCGHPAKPGGPYCADHHAIAYFATLPPLTLEALAKTPQRKVR